MLKGLLSKDVEYTSPYEFEGRIPLKQAFPLGIQHVLAMFVGNITPLIIICALCGISSSDPSLYIVLLQNSMLIAGVVTIIQLYSIGPIGGKVPIIMGTSSGFLGAAQGIVSSMGGGIIAYGAILGASIVGGLFETALGFCFKHLRRIFPPVVTGTVLLMIGIGLIKIGLESFAGGAESPDFGSWENLFVGFIVLLSIVLLSRFTKGALSSSAVMISIIIGYVLCIAMSAVLSTTFIGPDGEVYTKSWVIDWSALSDASWITVPNLLPVMPSFHLEAIIPMLVLFVVTTVETIGDTAGCVQGGMGREPTDRELSGAITCDGVGSVIAAFFGVLPNTSFSQNVGLVTMTKMVNRFALCIGALFLVLCGLCPKLAALLSVIPQSVLGGVAVILFVSIAVSGISLIAKEGMTTRTVTIVSVSLGVGLGLGIMHDMFAGLGDVVSLLLSDSGILLAAVIAIVLNIILPKSDPKGV